MKTTKCHFCGYVYTEDELVSKCGRCSMKVSHAASGVSCCPNCGIEVKMKSAVVDFIKTITSRFRAGKS